MARKQMLVVARPQPNQPKKNKNVTFVEVTTKKKKKKRSRGRGVAQTLRLRAPRSRRTKKLPMPSPEVMRDPDLVHYLLALADPFSPDAIGARIPDHFAGHTVTSVIRNTVSIQANGSGVAGLFLMPNPLVGPILAAGTNTGFSTMTFGDNSTLSTAFFPTPVTALNTLMQNWRVVGMGIRVTGMSSMTNSQGKFILGTYPIDSQFYTRTTGFTVGGALPATNAANTRSVSFNNWGIPNNAGTLSEGNLINYPGTETISALEGTEKEFEVIPKMVSPSALDFKPSGDTNFGYNWASGTQSGDAAWLSLNGFEVPFVVLTGSVATTSTIDVEYIYHLEGSYAVPDSATTSAPSPVYGAGEPSPVNVKGLWDVITEVASCQSVRQALKLGADMIHPLLGEFAKLVIP